MEKEKKENKRAKILDNQDSLNLKEFMLLPTREQTNKVNEILAKLYEDTLSISPKYVEKVLNLCYEVKDKDIYLPYNLKVSKEGSKVTFAFVEKRYGWLFLLFILAFLFAGIAATYVGVQYMNSMKLNIDINGDGIADLNIDMQGNGYCDINCDTDNDGKPDENVDYQGNRNALFNSVDSTGKVNNPVNQDLNDDGKCDLNCDTDNDVWPDINLDLDGDGKADLNVDRNSDSIPDINIDTNGDGKPDINVDNNGDRICDYNCTSTDTDNKRELNVDLDGDNKCDINCDTNDDGIPDKNLDYAGNKESTFNAEDENGNITNRTNQDRNNDSRCDLNCDIDKDGWPDTNLDINGDGNPDLNLDTNNDDYPDLNIDTDGDKACDLNCDDDGDKVCDRACTDIVVEGHGNGVIVQDGNGDTGVGTPSIIVKFESKNEVITDNLYPDDQGEEYNTKVPDLRFSIENPNDIPIHYSIEWIIAENTFTTDNLWYKVTSDNEGYNQDWIATPKADALISNEIIIPPHTIQNYQISLTLHGTGENQNEDQGKNFEGKVRIDIIR